MDWSICGFHTIVISPAKYVSCAETGDKGTPKAAVWSVLEVLRKNKKALDWVCSS